MSRLRRALSRLERAGNAILWLSADTVLCGGQPTPARPALDELVDELQPLAVARAQAFDVRVAPGLYWDAPREVVETLLANLLLNAIQHGDAGVIGVEADGGRLVICNRQAAADVPGFGLGLEIARRLAARIGWRLEMQVAAGMVRCELRWPAAACSTGTGQ